MKILVISNMYPSKNFPNYGIFVKNFVDICSENEIEIDKVVLEKHDKRVKKLSHYLLYYFSIFFKVLFKKYSYVYVHYAGQNSVPMYFLLKMKKNINLILNVHGSDIMPEKKIHEYLLPFTKKVLDKCKKVVVPSEYYKEILNKEFNVSTNKLYVFPSAGVNPKVFYNLNKKEAREEIKIPVNKRTIGFISRIDYGKGWDTLLESINILESKSIINSNEYQIVVVGTGKEINKFKNKIQQYRLEQYIQYFPIIEQKDLKFFYNSFDVFCFPTRRKSESLGLVALEALSCGTPVIASDFAAPSYYIKDSYNGFKFKVNSPKDLSTKIEDFFKLSKNQINILEENSIKSAHVYQKDNIKKVLLNDILGDKDERTN